MILNLVLSGVLVFGGIHPAIIQTDEITVVQGNRQKKPDPPNRPDGLPTGPSNSGQPDDLPSRDNRPRSNANTQQNQGSDRSQDVRQNEQRPRPQQERSQQERPRQARPRQAQPRQAQVSPAPPPRRGGVQEGSPQSQPIVRPPSPLQPVPEPTATETPTEIEETDAAVDRSDGGILVFDNFLTEVIERIPGWVWWQIAFSLMVIYGLWLYARYHNRRYNEFVEEVRRLIHGDLDGPAGG